MAIGYSKAVLLLAVLPQAKEAHTGPGLLLFITAVSQRLLSHTAHPGQYGCHQGTLIQERAMAFYMTDARHADNLLSNM